FQSKDYSAGDGPAGLLFSQIGYELGFPVRIVIRLPKKELLAGKTRCRLLPVSGGKKIEADCEYWGEIWGSHWWVAQFTPDQPGEWDVNLLHNGNVVISGSGLSVSKNLLWDATVELAAADMLERRVHFTKVGAGWQDAGTLWVESPAQSAMIISLCELLEKSAQKLNDSLKTRIEKQIIVGCDYLVMTQDKARELGYPEGSFSHDLLGHEKDVLPNDAVKAVIALTKASLILSEKYKGKVDKYKSAATKAYKWLLKDAKPVGDLGLSRFQRGVAEGVPIPENEWQTRDLVSLCWASIEQWKAGNQLAKDEAVKYAVQIIDRQISEEKAESGYFGHFIEYPSMPHSEKSWIHGIVNNTFGADIGGVYPNYLLPFLEMLKLWPDLKEGDRIKETLRSFTYNYLIPACEKNPFYLVPQGIFGNEGPIWFCGTFHGTNAIYGYTAALALELANFFKEDKLKAIAYGNLQWLAGLNAGITKENIHQGCVIFSTDIPEGAALPASMMCGVGKRWAGTWFQTRGVICNGFSTGKQFVYDVEPKKENDGSFSLTDEDWIPHSAGWLTGLMRL
ncbi:MAG: hypothetical protein HC905_13540, partial [Bacteroidales bacterium]|nr:hypothetical protein [Bacteroidales bacterium]